MSDPLANLLSHFSLHAGVFYTGNICGVHDFAQDRLRGHIHLIKSGAVRLIGARRQTLQIDTPTLIFLPRPDTHRLLADSLKGADVLCATVQFGGGGSNPVTDSLPDVVLVPLSELAGIEAVLTLLFDEAFARLAGRQAILDRLCEVLMIQMLRHCIANGLTQGGTLAGLADARLARTLMALHSDVARAWNLPAMAAVAGMSRARFALRFHALIGQTPADYLASMRVMAAQRLLKQGHSLKTVAFDVGYGSASALARAFSRKVGASPTDWLVEQAKNFECGHSQGHSA